MNTSHFPDLERCKKLTKVGFPETQMERIQNSFSKDWIWMTDKARNELFDKRCFENLCSTADVKRHYRCPSVSELLDEMPYWVILSKLKPDKYGNFKIKKEYTVSTSPCGSIENHKTHWTPANALSDMYIWLKENNYL